MEELASRYDFLNPGPRQKILSYLAPVLLWETRGDFHECLQIYLYRNQLQLTTDKALYSDGIRYMPFRIVFDAIGRPALKTRRQCLVLGCGLGSILQILHDQYQCRAHYTVVEQEPQILDWCRVLLGAKEITSLTTHLGDVALILPVLPAQIYDLICIDVFVDQVVPGKVASVDFLTQVKSRLGPAGIWILNYMEINPQRDEALRSHVEAVFPQYQVTKQRSNIVYWGRED